MSNRMTKRKRKWPRQNRGVVLILVLIVVSSLASISVGLAYCTRIELRLAMAHAQRTQTYHLALGGIERIKALINQQEHSPVTVARLSLFSNTAKAESIFEQLKNYEPAQEQTLAYGVRDEQGYFNVNTSDPAAWENLTAISRTHRASISDWIDTDDSPSSDGAESDFYQRLDPPLKAKNNPCTYIKELLFIRGITRELYIGEATIQGFLAGLTEPGRQYAVPFADSYETSNLGMIDIFTVYGDGNLNINTTSRTILSALPGLDEGVADTIKTYRAGPDALLGTADDRCFTTSEDFMEVEGLSELQVELLEQYCGFNSEYFRVFSYARLNNISQCYLMATIKRTENASQLVCVERLL